jgi:SAM-dependent methyltransferase
MPPTIGTMPICAQPEQLVSHEPGNYAGDDGTEMVVVMASRRRTMICGGQRFHWSVDSLSLAGQFRAALNQIGGRCVSLLGGKLRTRILAEVNLLHRYPKAKRNIEKRTSAQGAQNIEIARQYGREYFDGARDTGYGGYRYDGRWMAIAEDMVAHWGLKPEDRVLDVGCAKGFLVKDLMKVNPGVEAFGLDISEYALMNCEPEVIGRLHLGNCMRMPFPDKSFSAVVAINVVHNLERDDCIRAVREIERLAPGRGYIQVDSYRTPREEEIFLSWVLTAKTHYDPDGWRQLFDEAGYTGDYSWTIIE